MGDSLFSTTETEEEPSEDSIASPLLAFQWVHPPEFESSTALESGRYVIGRAHSCKLRLQSEKVSRQHAELRVMGPHCRIVDSDSVNGTYVDGVRVRESAVRRGSVIRVGDCVGVVTAHHPGVACGLAELAPGLWGGAGLRALLEPLRRMAGSSLPVVLEGATGTGKEVFARAIHQLSRRSGPFIGVNCAAIPEGLAEAELFGHARGAFTGAERARRGYLRTAHRGTLLLDEILDLPAAIQSKLLRAIELGSVSPIGETRTYELDVRVVSAAQRPLTDAVRGGLFRPDLFARLNGITVELPALKERREDIPGLFRLFMQEAAPEGAPRLAPGAVELLCCHPFPHNVRELQQLARKMAALHNGAELRAAYLVRDLSKNRKLLADEDVTSDHRLEELRALQQALRSCDGNVSRASALVGISRQKAYRLFKQFDANAVQPTGRGASK